MFFKFFSFFSQIDPRILKEIPITYVKDGNV